MLYWHMYWFATAQFNWIHTSLTLVRHVIWLETTTTTTTNNIYLTLIQFNHIHAHTNRACPCCSLLSTIICFQSVTVLTYYVFVTFDLIWLQLYAKWMEILVNWYVWFRFFRFSFFILLNFHMRRGFFFSLPFSD